MCFRYRPRRNWTINALGRNRIPYSHIIAMKRISVAFTEVSRWKVAHVLFWWRNPMNENSIHHWRTLSHFRERPWTVFDDERTGFENHEETTSLSPSYYKGGISNSNAKFVLEEENSKAAPCYLMERSGDFKKDFRFVSSYSSILAILNGKEYAAKPMFIYFKRIQNWTKYRNDVLSTEIESYSQLSFGTERRFTPSKSIFTEDKVTPPHLYHSSIH